MAFVYGRLGLAERVPFGDRMLGNVSHRGTYFVNDVTRNLEKKVKDGETTKNTVAPVPVANKVVNDKTRDQKTLDTANALRPSATVNPTVPATMVAKAASPRVSLSSKFRTEQQQRAQTKVYASICSLNIVVFTFCFHYLYPQ
ncbi:unnamed protein product [Soboliphyme baturini]|uniref:Doublecortin domain-containing protein n=1 Tax=Soboliphyme baturini TaxID=241478 RepID=A0A183J576_9BILA|nr:unnamed protein product [Soboliphyme baturini]